MHPDRSHDPDPRDRSRLRPWALVAAASTVVLLLTAGVVGLALGGDDDPLSGATSEVRPDGDGTASGGDGTASGGDGTASGGDGTASGGDDTASGGDKTAVVREDLKSGQGPFPREYTILSPAGMEEGDDLPVVVVLHGLGSDRFAMMAAADWEAAIAEHDFVAVFPQGQLGAWNAGRCCPPANVLNTADTGFIDRMMKEVRERPGVDPERAYLTGFSNGGIMAYAEACRRPGLFTAIAPIAGSNIGGCAPGAPVPTLHIHGDPDPVVPYDGGATAAEVLLSTDFPSVEGSVRRWATDMGCEPRAVLDSDPGDQVRRRHWEGCDDDVTVELVTHPGNGHGWPNGRVDGLAEVLRFFGLDD